MSKPEGAEGIAVIGMSGRFPEARNLAEFWKNLLEGRCSLTQLSDAQIAAAGYDPAALRAEPGYVGVRGLLDRPEWFDREFFGISAAEAAVLDPQQRVFLEVAWEALEDAALDPTRYPGAIGVYAGTSNNTYFANFVRHRPDLRAALGPVTTMLGNEKDFLTPRLAYKLNLRGPALNIQTACSTSLVAIAAACQSLLDYQCDAALAGGVSITFPHERGYFFQEGAMVSPDGTCRPFDARANGTVFSNGAGVIVLKRVEDALADGDPIYAVIRGHAVNNDGAGKVSFAAPSVEGQAEVIALAQALAGTPPESISYIEAHGTATPMGDPIEVAGLSAAFGEMNGRQPWCALGSVKGNIGHLDAASGVAGVIKTALALRHRTIPATIGTETPHAELHLPETPFQLATTQREWVRGETPRRAGVSSLGVGGTNAHVVLEEAPELPPVARSGERKHHVFVLSAKNEAALQQRAEDLAARLEADASLDLTAVAWTLQTGRQQFAHRRAVIAATAAEAIDQLRGPRKMARESEARDLPVALVFPGQGSQYPGMGRALYEAEPVFRAALDECAEALRPHLDADLRELVFATGAEARERLKETRLTQPAIFALDYALGQLWLSRVGTPKALAGHSVGEFAAAVLAGVMSLSEAARLVALRARLVQELPGGAMLAVRLSEEAVKVHEQGNVAIAAVNSHKLCVLAGPEEEIAAIAATLEQEGTAARRLETSHAFHSPMVEPALAPFADAVRGVALSTPQIPVVSCVTGQLLTDAEATDPRYWAQHLRATVRFADAMETLLQQDCAIVEAGPGQALEQLIWQHPNRRTPHEVVHTIAEEEDEGAAFATAHARLWLAGVTIDWRAVHGGEPPRRIALPVYPFQRERCFADLPAGVALPLTTAATDGEPTGALSCAAPAAVAHEHGQTPTDTSTAEAAPVPGPAATVLALLGELTGHSLEGTPGETTLLELGLDSLSLSQAAVTLTRKFSVKITFRQLLGELSTVGALCDFVAANAQTPMVSPAGGAAPAVVIPAAAPQAAHGPFRPLQRRLDAALTDRQQRWLDDFTKRYTARTARSKAHVQEHRRHLSDPRAVSGFKQAWKEIIYPIVVGRSAGARLWDLDGNEWIDITLSFGAAMLGHQPEFVTKAVAEQLTQGFEVGPTSPLAGEVAALLCDAVGMERVTFCSTGSEAVTGALRVARTVTGRSKFVFFTAAYHGIDSEVLGRPGGTRTLPIAPGIPDEIVANAVILPYGSPEALEYIERHGDDLAAVLVEAVQSRHPGLQPREFLHTLREITARHGTALIFDEIVTGFRCGLGGAQAHFGVRADLATYGKILGGGLPIGVIAGSAAFLDAMDGGWWSFGDDSFPEAAVTFFAGTFVRHPLALAAARAVLLHLKEQGPALQENLNALTERLCTRVAAALRGTPYSVERFASNWKIIAEDGFAYAPLIYAALRSRGIHAWDARPTFLSTAHTEADVDAIARACEESVAELRDAGFFGDSAAVAAPTPAPVATPERIPMTEGQREMWLVCQLGEKAISAFNETWTLLLDGPLEFSAMQSAVREIVARHDALRSTFNDDGETLRVAAEATLDLPLLDLSALEESARKARLEELRAAEGERVFDLRHGPMLALQLVKLAPERHALIFNAHHLVCDGWSCDIVLSELAELYSAAREGRPHRLEPPMSLLAYQQWETAFLGSEEYRTELDYWLTQHRHPAPDLELPGDRPHPGWRTYAGADGEIILPADLAQALTRTGAKHGATFFSVLLAAYEALLYRLTGQREFAVGVPSAGQNNVPGGEHLIGHCVNVLPLRAHLDPAQPFSALLQAVQQTMLEGFEHQRVTFGALLKHLAMRRVPGRIPLVPVTFNLDPALSHVAFSGLQQRLKGNPRAAYQFDLSFNCDLNPDGLRIICHYNTDIFDASTIDRFLRQYAALLHAVAEDPSRAIDDLSTVPLPPAAMVIEQTSSPTEAAAPAPALAGAPASAAPVWAPVELWPSSPSAGEGLLYDDVMYNFMSQDESRHEVYRQAIRLCVRDKVVVDVGTGRDALLAIMSVEAGARKVYAIEVLEEPARLAKEKVARMGLQDKITVLHGRAEDVNLPELGEVLTGENFGHIGGAEAGDLLAKASQRLMKPGAIYIPGRCQSMMAAVSMPENFLADPRFEQVGAYYAQQTWKAAGRPHDLRLCVTNTSRALLSSTADVFEDLDLSGHRAPEPSREVTLEITREAKIDGFLIWLLLETAPGVMLEAIDYSDTWLAVYLPAFYPGVEVRPGDRITATVFQQLTASRNNRDYRVRGMLHRPGRTDISFDFDSPHAGGYKATPFYAHLFRDDDVKVSERQQQARAAAAPLAAGERRHEQAEWNRTARPFADDRGVHQIFSEIAAQQPNAAAVLHGETQCTYGELDRRSGIIAARLREAGAAPGVRIAIALPRSIDLIAAILGILKTGAAYVPIDPATPQERVALMLRETSAARVIGTLNAAVDRPVRALASLEQGEPIAQPIAVDGNAEAYVMFTSGSTGLPKGAAIPHRGIARLVLNTDYVQLGAGDTVGHASNPAFDASTFEIWGALLNGGRIAVLDHETMLAPDAFAARLRTVPLDALFITTPLFHQFAQQSPGVFGGVRDLLVGGDVLDARLAQAVLTSATPPRRLSNIYGPTEATTFALCHRITQADGAVRIPIGRPIANTTAYVLDANLVSVPTGESGELYIGGPGVALGYLNRPELTAERFIADPFSEQPGARLYKTGDMVKRQVSGPLEFLGRQDRQVKVRGFRVELGEIEHTLRTHPAVRECVLHAETDSAAGHVLKAYAVLRSGADAGIEALRSFLADRLPEYMVPQSITLLEQLPLTPNGKIDHDALPGITRQAAAHISDAKTPVERELCSIWEQLLGRNGFSVRDDFFLLGGHSLLAIQLLSRIRERFRVDVPVRKLFETPTIEALSQHIAASLVPQAAVEYRHLVAIQRGDDRRRPLFLVPGGWGSEIEFVVYARLARTVDPDLPLYGLRARQSAGDHVEFEEAATMAAAFVEELRMRQPRGPYMLAGECVGGVVAYEMARLLAAQGEKICLLALLDTVRPGREILKQFVAEERAAKWNTIWNEGVRNRASYHLKKLSALPVAEKVQYVWKRLRQGPTRSEDGLPSRDVATEYPRKIMGHTLQPYEGKITLVLAEDVHNVHGKLGWEAIPAEQLETHLVPGDHISYIRDHATAIAGVIREILRLANEAKC